MPFIFLSKLQFSTNEKMQFRLFRLENNCYRISENLNLKLKAISFGEIISIINFNNWRKKKKNIVRNQQLCYSVVNTQLETSLFSKCGLVQNAKIPISLFDLRQNSQPKRFCFSFWKSKNQLFFLSSQMKSLFSFGFIVSSIHFFLENNKSTN